MSHELRTPLNAILGFSKLLLDDPGLVTGQRDYARLINRAGQHLLSLINDILDVSKIEAGRASAELAAFDLPALIDDVCELMGGRVAAKGLTLHREPAPDLPRYVVSDAAKLRQILLNLLANAVNYTPEGSVTVRASSAGDKLILVVADTGVGVAPDDVPRIFELFTQVGDVNSRAGTGLGLTICQQFATLLGGHVTVESVLGVGSAFTLTLPLVLADPEAVRAPSPNGATLARLAPGQPQYRALVVDDRSENALLLRSLLDRAGFQTQVAFDGATGVTLFQQFSPHIVFMDWLMPVMDGLEATRRIRALPEGRDVAVIAVTAVAFAAEHAKLLEAGVDEVVNKPYEVADILGAAAAHLGCSFVSEPTSELQAADAPAGEPASQVDGGQAALHRLASLPAAARERLGAALIELDPQAVEAAIAQIGELDPGLALALRELTDSYQYGLLLDSAFPELTVRSAPER